MTEVKKAKLDAPNVKQAKDRLSEESERLQEYQDDIKQKLAAGEEFLREVAEPTLPRSESVAGVCADLFDLFVNDEWDDCMHLALSECIESWNGKGVCRKWLHDRFRGLTHGSPHTVWDCDANVSAMWMVLRHVRITDATVAECYKIRSALNQMSNGQYPEFDWDKAATRFFATLDNDPYWAAHAIACTENEKKKKRVH